MKRFEICSKLIKTRDQGLMFLLLTLNIFYNFSTVSFVDFEQVNVSWGVF